MDKTHVSEKFDKLTIIEDLGYYQKEGTKRKRHYVKCLCDCGNTIIRSLDTLCYNNSFHSCGCSVKEAAKEMGHNSKKFNDFEIKDKIVYVNLYNTDKKLICDLEDWERLKIYCWGENGDGYARARNIDTGKNILFHQEVLHNKYIDHINGNRLDNRKSNLRLANKSQNAMNQKIRIDNKTGYKGVSKRKNGGYYSKITINKKIIYLGSFDTIEEAIEAREKAEIKYFGEYRRI